MKIVSNFLTGISAVVFLILVCLGIPGFIVLCGRMLNQSWEFFPVFIIFWIVVPSIKFIYEFGKWINE